MDFYKIKEGMDEQHKVYLNELKQAYNNSQIELKRQEGIVQARVDQVSAKLAEAIKQLKITKDETDTLMRANEKLKADNSVLEVERAQFYLDRSAEELKRKEWLDKVANEKENLAEQERLSSVRIAEREAQAIKKEADSNYAIDKNNEILEAIKQKQAELDIAKQEIIEAKALLETNQSQYQADIKSLEQRRYEVDAKEARNGEREKELDKREQALDYRDNSLNIKDTSLKEKEEDISDRELEADLREIELNRKQTRAESLMAIYEEKSRK